MFVVHIAAVSSDESIRLKLARAFDPAPASWTVTLHHTAPPDADLVVCGPERPDVGQVRFDPDRPELLVPEIADRLASTAARCIFVVGAVGGCGASTIALHLAAASGGCLIDASGHGVRRRLALATARSWSEGLVDDDLELSALPVAPGFRVLLAPATPQPDEVGVVLQRAAAYFDHVLVDAAAPSVASLASRGGLGVLVLTPTRPAAESAREILESNDSLRWAIVTNRVGPGGALRSRALEDLLGRRIAIDLPCSAGLRDTEDEGRLLTSPMSPWLWQVKKLWRALETA